MAKLAQKLTGKMVQAYCLGSGSEMELSMIKDGKIVVNKDGTFELFSQECKSGEGEKAVSGDYFKVDNAGYPYPNNRAWFKANHKHVEGDTFEQLPKPLMAWEASDEVTPEVQFLIDQKGLVLDESNEDQYFGAELWGAWETSPKDSVLIFYSVSYNEDGTVSDADFNFIARDEFSKTYSFC